MDFVIASLDRKIRFLKKSTDNEDKMFVYLKSKVEYMLIFLLAYLWNKNFEQVDSETKELVLSEISSPSIGTIVEVSRLLDLKSEFFGNKKLSAAINDYPSFRNNRIGHGYTYEDSIKVNCEKLEQISNAIVENCDLLNGDIDYVVTKSEVDGIVRGIIYDCNGIDYDCYSSPADQTNAKSQNVYALLNNSNLIRVSPFIEVANEDCFYIFRDIKEKLLGKVRYCQVMKTGEYYRSWDELCNVVVDQDGIRKKTQNGTIINYFENNFKKYIEIGIKKQIASFLIKNKSSVCATVWGHGGVGKTASVQSVCGDLCVGTKQFDYIVFYSAKDRYYNCYNGEVVCVSKARKKFNDIIELGNEVINGEVSADPTKISNSSFKTLLVLDDYETFSMEERKKIEEFIRTLNINSHKVLITTRANIVIGDEIVTNELPPDKTIDFLFEILKNEFNIQNIVPYKVEISSKECKTAIHTITSGRPIFIFQFAYLWMQNGNINKIIHHDLKNSEAAFDFLYGRIFDYLSATAKNIFCAISQIVDDSDLSNLLSKLAYIVGLESKIDEFDSAIKELEKLRIIETDDKFFKVYSKEIYEIMKRSFESSASSQFKRRVIDNITTTGSDNTFSVEDALLQTANASRYTKSEEEVISLYEIIIQRDITPKNIKYQAILNATNYLANDRGKRYESIALAEKYFDIFKADNRYIKLYARLSWSAGGRANKAKAISTIENYFRDPATKLTREDKTGIDIFSLMLMFKSIYWIDERKQLKAASRLGSIEEADFKSAYGVQRSQFNEILKEGGVYKEFIFNLDMSKCDTEEKVNIVNTLGLLVDVAIRVQNFSFAEDVCVYAMHNLPHIEQASFQRRLALIDQYRSGSTTN